MTGRYIPPHLRNKAQSSSGQENTPPAPTSSQRDENLLTVDEIVAIFWPKTFDLENKHDDQQAGASNSSTLHASEADPSKLSFVILFRGANPRWFADKIIYAKSNLDLLPTPPPSQGTLQTPESTQARETTKEPSYSGLQSEEPQGSTQTEAFTAQNGTSLTSPIPIFQELSDPRPRNIRFAGYYSISHLSILAPHSPELVRMLEQKWSFTDRRGTMHYKERDAESWKKSLGFKWAVMKFKAEPGADEKIGAPKITRREGGGGNGSMAGKSVNEMLSDLRMGGKDKIEHESNLEGADDGLNGDARETAAEE
ncbi:MAG: hypothetical protein Q9165_003745 [Trypethelium subeluteriae]